MRSTAFVLTVMMTCAAAEVAHACGDKFLLVGRGLAFGRAYASIYPGSIVIYGQPAAKSQVEKLHEAIRKAGHRIAMIDAPANLSARLSLQPTDIVIADASSKAVLDQEIAALAVKPSVLYLVSEADRKQIASDAGGVAVKSTEKSGRFLALIEDIMKARQTAGVRVKKG
jgi:hypothetical protein